MRLFKSTDERLESIGFVKIKEDKYGATYERENKRFNYIQVLDLLHKQDGQHLIQSYQKDVNKDNFNNVVGLTICESNLAIKKMKQMGLR